MDLKIALLVLIFSLASLAKADWDEAKEWSDFKIKFHKKYSSPDEEELRKTIWGENLKFIEKHNKEADEGLHTFRVGINHFGDLTSKEFSDSLKSSSKYFKRDFRKQGFLKPPSFKSTDFPLFFDWRAFGCVGDVRVQSITCNDEYASFPADTIASFKCAENRWAGRYEPLSSQQIIDCSRSFGNEGCQGGLLDNTYRYVIKTGLESEKNYPSSGTGECAFNPSLVSATIKGFTVITSGNETDLMNAITYIGPVTVGVDASQPSFQFYKSGIYYEPGCSTNADLLLLATGYGQDDPSNLYYYARNSWSISWGEQGYIRMSRYKNNNCGIASLITYPIL